MDQGSIEVVAHFASELDADGKHLRVLRFTDYTGKKAHSMCPFAAKLRSHDWASRSLQREFAGVIIVDVRLLPRQNVILATLAA